jgi:type VI secretion system secreted protein VgrG
LPASPGDWPLDPSAFPASFETQLYEYVTGGSFDATNKSGGETSAELQKIVQALQAQAKLHAQAGAAGSSRLVGSSTATGLMAGAKVGIRCGGQADVNGDYFVTSVQHQGANGSYVGGDGNAWSYSNEFTCIPHSVLYRPPRVTPWPTVPGVHVATVVGPSGEEIFTDKFGRVRVVFEWNRDAETPNGPGDTCWVRVAQMVSGPGWGSFFLPRIGHQVLVSFLGGDPDQPVVVGSLYNDVNMPQVKLPDDKTQSAIRTRSTPRGSAEMYNELRFEDKKDAELVVFQAQKDFKGLIKHDSTLIVKEGNQTVTVEQGDQSLTVTKGKLTITVEQNHATTVKSGDMTTEVKAGKSSLEVQGDIAMKSKSAKMLLEAMADITVKSTGGKIEISSPLSIELKVGGSSIKVSPTGVEVSGPQVKVSGSAQAEVSGGGMLTLKGGVVMIN